MSNSPASIQKKAAFSTKQLVSLAMFCALAIVVMTLSKLIPRVAGFLQFDFKDTVIAISGFLFGPLSAIAVSVVVSVIDTLIYPATGPIGLLMNILATCAFVCPAAYLYHKKQTLKHAVLGLLLGSIAMTATMLLWNYLITPVYMGVDRSIVVAMILPTLLPFNLLKSGMNAALIILVYKPVVNALRKAHIVPEQRIEAEKPKVNWGAVIGSAFLLITFILLGLVMAGAM